jgi:hypothetical protein
VKHHLPPLGDRQTALSAAFSSIIVDTNVFKSFRVPLHVNLLFFWPKKTIQLAVDKFRKISVLSESSSQSSLAYSTPFYFVTKSIDNQSIDIELNIDIFNI